MGNLKTLGIGFYFDELEAGMRFQTLSRTITEPDIVGFIGITGMVETLFTDLSFTHEHGPLKGRVAPAALSYTIIEGLLCQHSMQTTGLALLEVEKKILAPVVAGDTIHCEVEVVSVRATSKGNRGIVKTKNDIINQDGVTVITYLATRMMAGTPDDDPRFKR